MVGLTQQSRKLESFMDSRRLQMDILLLEPAQESNSAPTSEKLLASVSSCFSIR